MLLKSLPNLLSFLRILIALSFPLLPPPMRLPFLGIALVTEYLDGALARAFGWVTDIGILLDPLADRTLALIVGLTLISTQQMSVSDFVMTFFRDLVVSFGFIYIVFIRRRKDEMKDFKPDFLGKLTTGLQYLVLLNILSARHTSLGLLFLTQAASLMAAVWYVLHFNSGRA